MTSDDLYTAFNAVKRRISELEHEIKTYHPDSSPARVELRRLIRARDGLIRALDAC